MKLSVTRINHTQVCPILCGQFTLLFLVAGGALSSLFKAQIPCP